MKKSVNKKILFLCLLVISAMCFSYLSIYGTESTFVSYNLENSTDMQSASMESVNGMKDVVIKIIKMMMLQF